MFSESMKRFWKKEATEPLVLLSPQDRRFFHSICHPSRPLLWSRRAQGNDSVASTTVPPAAAVRFKSELSAPLCHHSILPSFQGSHSSSADLVLKSPSCPRPGLSHYTLSLPKMSRYCSAASPVASRSSLLRVTLPVLEAALKSVC